MAEQLHLRATRCCWFLAVIGGDSASVPYPWGAEVWDDLSADAPGPAPLAPPRHRHLRAGGEEEAAMDQHMHAHMALTLHEDADGLAVLLAVCGACGRAGRGDALLRLGHAAARRAPPARGHDAALLRVLHGQRAGGASLQLRHLPLLLCLAWRSSTVSQSCYRAERRARERERPASNAVICVPIPRHICLFLGL